MTNSSKKIFLAVCIIVPFTLYCTYYYGMMIKNAAYKFSEFKSITFKYGFCDSLINQYNSESGTYQYLNERDSLIKKTVKLSKDELLHLHRKATELGFWNFPELLNPPNKVYKNSPRYYIKYTYKQKEKEVLFDIAYNQDEKLRDAISKLIKEISKSISDAED